MTKRSALCRQCATRLILGECPYCDGKAGQHKKRRARMLKEQQADPYGRSTSAKRSR